VFIDERGFGGEVKGRVECLGLGKGGFHRLGDGTGVSNTLWQRKLSPRHHITISYRYTQTARRKLIAH